MGSGKWEVRRSSHSAFSLNGQKSEIGSSHFVKSEVGSRKTLLAFELKFVNLVNDVLPWVPETFQARFPVSVKSL